MAKVFGVHPFSLKYGVKPEDFERFVKEEVPQLPALEGVTLYILKGDRGDRGGKYLMLIETESVELRDRYWPTPDTISDEANKLLIALGRWGNLVMGPGSPISTDYVVIEQSR
jgi:hypothetical protein